MSKTCTRVLIVRPLPTEFGRVWSIWDSNNQDWLRDRRGARLIRRWKEQQKGSGR